MLAGGEVGYNWFRAVDDYDHIHLTAWYADEVSSANFDTESGWGLRLSGHKQWNRLVGFANYSYNTAKGGPLGLTNTRNAANAGLAYLNPFGVKGELALGGSWGNPFDEELREQTGMEVYWKILTLPNL